MKHYEVIGIGFGPAAISLAIAYEDQRLERGIKPNIKFLESSRQTVWQEGLLLRGTDIQHHFLRDLVTPRNPRSSFTFVNYLHQHKRLFRFGELVFGSSGGGVGRLEWSDYVNWAASSLNDYVDYATCVTKIVPIYTNARLSGFEVYTTRDSYSCKKLVLASGKQRNIPDIFSGAYSCELAIHAADYLNRVDPSALSNKTVAVIGSGQSAIEIIQHLHESNSSITLHSFHRGLGFKHVDLSQFTNDIFHPEETSYAFNIPDESKAEYLSLCYPTNYSAVDAEAADSLYRRLYEDEVTDIQRVFFHKKFAIKDCTPKERLIIGGQDIFTGAVKKIAVDLAILCTGYKEACTPAYFPELTSLASLSGNGPRLDENFKLRLTKPGTAEIYLHGLLESQHGIGNTASFSQIAIRSGIIFKSLHKSRRNYEKSNRLDLRKNYLDGPAKIVSNQN